eukprot:gene14148-18986_t
MDSIDPRSLLFSIASTRWLTTEELMLVLKNPMIFGLNCSLKQPDHPKSGDIFVFNKINGVSYKNDGISWMKKKGKDRIQETYQNIKVNGIETIKGVYSRCAENQNFKRRIYRMVDVEQYPFILVHYLLEVSHNNNEFSNIETETVTTATTTNYSNSTNSNSMSQNPFSYSSQSQFPSQQQHYMNHIPTNYQELNRNSHNNSNNNLNYHQNVLAKLPQQPQNICMSDETKNMNFNEHLFSENNLIRGMSLINNHVNNNIINSNYDNIESEYSLNEVMTSRIGSFEDVKDEWMTDLIFLASSVDHPIMDINHNNNSENDYTDLLRIEDYAPCNTIVTQCGIKILICFKNEIPLNFRQQNNLMVMFGDRMKVVAEIVTPNVIRCYSPFLQTGHYYIQLCDLKGNVVSNLSSEPFVVAFPSQQQTIPIDVNPSLGMSLGKRNASNTIINNSISSLPSLALALDSNQQALTIPVNININNTPPTLGHNNSNNSNNSIRITKNDEEKFENSFSDRENKIRIVEKLGFMKSALLSTDNNNNYGQSNAHTIEVVPGGNSNYQTNITSWDSDVIMDESNNNTNSNSNNNNSNNNDGLGEWLDDLELSKLSNNEIEAIMERDIMSVVKQLVQLASLDDDLKAEINSLDTTGFSLLHYCCLYNLNSLIPVMLTRGADINQRTSTNSTALHLAASSGHLAVSQLLIDSGSNPLSIDINNCRASDKAKQAGFMDIYDYLIGAESAAQKQGNFSVDSPSSVGYNDQLTKINDGMNSLHNNNNEEFSSLLISNNNIYNNSIHSSPDHISLVSKDDLSYLLSNPTTPNYIISDNTNLPDNNNTTSTTNNNSNNNPLKTTSISSLLLHEAFNSLSLTDKCALSLSMSQQYPTNNSNLSNTSSVIDTTNSIINSPRDWDQNEASFTSSNNDNNNALMGVGMSDGLRLPFVDDLEIEMQSVISETDKESLDVAMSMMDYAELKQVEDEVRKIQNNVRGWLLRKNYTNLRGAARVLQLAWREKKRNTSFDSSHNNNNNMKPIQQFSRSSHGLMTSTGKLSSSTTSSLVQIKRQQQQVTNALPPLPSLSTLSSSASTMSALLPPSLLLQGINNNVNNNINNNNGNYSVNNHFNYEFNNNNNNNNPNNNYSGLNDERMNHNSDNNDNDNTNNDVKESQHSFINHDDNHLMIRQVNAAATLQKATRGMLARKSFASVRKQAMASLIIQKKLMN